MRSLLAQASGVSHQHEGKEVSTGKVVANAGSHRILDALSTGPKSTKELKHVVGAVNSLARFDNEYMGRMLDNGYVKRQADGWVITKAGLAKLEQLGPVRGNKRRHIAGPRTHVGKGLLDLTKLYITPRRPGAEDFLKYPSRMGRELRYRDGRVVIIGADDGH